MNPKTTASGRSLRILYVAYPLLPVSEHSAGGAEQVLWTLEREMHSRGFETTVAACVGSQVAGALFETGDQAELVDQFEARSKQQTRMVVEWLSSGADAQFDLLHDMSGAFWQVRALSTLWQGSPRSLNANPGAALPDVAWTIGDVESENGCIPNRVLSPKPAGTPVSPMVIGAARSTAGSGLFPLLVEPRGS